MSNQSLQYPRDLFWSLQQSLHPLFTSDQPCLRVHSHTREWELQMEQLNHAEEQLCISALASSQTPLPAGPSLTLTCHHLSPARPPAHGRVNSEPLEPSQHSALFCFGADDRERDRNKFSSSLACLTRALCVLSSDRLSTICSLLQPKRTVREGGDESAAPEARFRMEATF